MTDSMGPGKLVRHMQNLSYTYDEYLICIGLAPSISSFICKNPSFSGPSYPSSPVYVFHFKPHIRKYISCYLFISVIRYTKRFGITFYYILCEKWPFCDYPVINGWGNPSTPCKPPPNPKSLVIYSHASVQTPPWEAGVVIYCMRYKSFSGEVSGGIPGALSSHFSTVCQHFTKIDWTAKLTQSPRICI